MNSHATGRGSGQPTPAQLKELFAQIESGRVNKGRLQEFLRGSTQAVTLEVAREIVGKKNFFGPKEWTKFFGKKFQLANIPEIPRSKNELENPEINQEHFLFLRPDRLDGKPLNLQAWHEIYPGGNHPKFYLDWYLSHKFAQGVCEPRWHLMPVGIVKGSTGLIYDRQVAMQCFIDEYEVPTTSARVTANILYYLLNKKYLDTDYWARTCDLSDSGNPVIVQGDSDDGLVVRHWYDDAYDRIGVSASRNLL
ncbi:MAG: hypothetical protein UU12_C0012G0018 [Candidatus Woesebacteria bacterium GW2011_GWA2_40_7b]|uniref:Uncharacterized protein n=1 Tax=Candidatus Woesebacteria bacterium GW2011_GWA2_40_7b TaxID=1618563 RepID=A0A0G0W6T3_9BACT|nr:MAG: hypothetical protein UU12_C0012G0018 [Candidatus Woesebacteria bacterium GW2011_GWA2_40_7b]